MTIRNILNNIAKISTEDFAQAMVVPANQLPTSIKSLIKPLFAEQIKQVDDNDGLLITNDLLARVKLLTNIFNQTNLNKIFGNLLQVLTEKRVMLHIENDKQWYQNELLLLESQVNQLVPKLEKITLLQSACDDYANYLSNSLTRKYPQAMAGEVRCSDKIYQEGVEKLDAVTQLQNILLSKWSTNTKLFQFEILFRKKEKMLAHGRDNATTLFLRIVATVLTLGFAAPFLWHKTKGAQLGAKINAVLQGRKNKIEPVELQDKIEQVSLPSYKR